MIPIAELKHDSGRNGSGSAVFKRGDMVFVLGYLIGHEAVVMHPKKGWGQVPLYSLTPKGFRTHVGAVP